LNEVKVNSVKLSYINYVHVLKIEDLVRGVSELVFPELIVMKCGMELIPLNGTL
jgi:hypothetical protein